jgi:hypothetical protein
LEGAYGYFEPGAFGLIEGAARAAPPEPRYRAPARDEYMAGSALALAQDNYVIAAGEIALKCLASS